jgi:ABC-type phosphate/phosphonate transport system substrate-binding protein
MQATASLPMYLVTPDHVEALWTHLRALLAAQGLRHLPLQVSWPSDLPSHWLEPGLLLSQACGYPLMTHLAGRVRLVGTFCYQVPGSIGHLCRSQLVARAKSGSESLADFRGRTVAYNSTDSQSGYNSLRAMVAPLAEGGRFFARAVASGSHRRSLEMVRDGLADIASIDCVTLAGLRAYLPDICEGLCVVGESAPYPGLPLITSMNTSDADMAALRTALGQAAQSAALATTLGALFISGFEAIDLAAYQVCLDMQDQALAMGCDRL